MTAAFDQCPGIGKGLFIGGFIGLNRKEALKNCNITHIVSVLDWEFKNETSSSLIRGYKHLHIPVDDVEDENLLEWFPTSNRFVKEGLEYQPAKPSDDVYAAGQGSGVYIHCAMGKSRSATILLAYLLWSSRQQSQSTQKVGDTEDMVSLPPRGLSVVEALELLRQGRAICEPNEGFMDQLHMYQDMGCPTTDAQLKSHKIYRRWMNRRKVEESLRVMQAPDMENIIFEDESDEEDQDSGSKKHMKKVAEGVYAPDGKDESKSLAHAKLMASPQVTIKCRKCRHALATTPFIVDHKPPPHRDPSTEIPAHLAGTLLPPPICAHLFLHPLSWMKEVLSEGKMEGRLTCPNTKCGSNIGKFSWSGLRCSCGGWITPGFGLIRGKVDELVTRRQGSVGETADIASSGVAAGIRLPPGMKRQGNL